MATEAHLLASRTRSLSSTLRPSCTVPPNPVAWQNILQAHPAPRQRIAPCMPLRHSLRGRELRGRHTISAPVERH